MTGGSSVLKALRYGPAEEARLGQPEQVLIPNQEESTVSWPEGVAGAAHRPCEQIPASSTLFQLVTSPGRKAKTRLKSANMGFVMSHAASFDCSCLHLKEKRVPKNVKEVNNFSFWCKNGTVFQNSCLNTDINLNKQKKRAKRFYFKTSQKEDMR